MTTIKNLDNGQRSMYNSHYIFFLNAGYTAETAHEEAMKAVAKLNRLRNTKGIIKY